MFPEKGFESVTLTCVSNGARPGGRTVDVAKLQKLVKDQGFLIDGGYGKIKGTTFRISNMGDETEATMNQLYRRAGQGDDAALIDIFPFPTGNPRQRIAGFAFRLPPVRQDAAVSTSYTLVYLRNGARSIRSLAEAETFHPVIGPAIEAEALYVRQLRLPERVQTTPGEFVIWDVGLGAAANALTAIRLIRESLQGKPAQLRLVSFDHTSEAAAFALEHGAELGYMAGYESTLAELVQNRSVKFNDESLSVHWTLELGDFPTFLSRSRRGDEAHSASI